MALQAVVDDSNLGLKSWHVRDACERSLVCLTSLKAYRKDKGHLVLSQTKASDIRHPSDMYPIAHVLSFVGEIMPKRRLENYQLSERTAL